MLLNLLAVVVVCAIVLLVAHAVMNKLGADNVSRMLVYLLILVVIVGIWWTQLGGSAIFT